MGLIDAIGGRRAYLDANIFIYAVEGAAPYAVVLEDYFIRVARGEQNAVTSELALAEVLVKPFVDRSRERQRAFEQALRTQGGLTVLAVTKVLLIQAARLRATTRLKLPDAIHAATAREAACDVFLTNDGRIKHLPDLDVLQLADLV